LDDYDINMISPDAFKFLVQLWLIASEDRTMQGLLPSPDAISFRLRLKKDKCLSLLKEIDSFLISDCHQDDIALSTLDRGETETEKRQSRGEGQQSNQVSSSTLTAPQRGTTVPSSFEMTDALKAWAAQNGFSNLDKHTEKFLDYHRSKGSVFKDWAAAWRTWLRNSTNFAAPVTANNSRDGLVERVLARQAEQEEREKKWK